MYKGYVSEVKSSEIILNTDQQWIGLDAMLDLALPKPQQKMIERLFENSPK